MATCFEGLTLHLLWAFMVSHVSLRLAIITVLSTIRPPRDVEGRSMSEDIHQQVWVTPSSRLW